MTDAFDPQAQPAPAELPGDPSDLVRTGESVPTPEEINESQRDGSGGDAVSSLPTDEHPDDLEEARERVGWDVVADENAAG